MFSCSTENPSCCCPAGLEIQLCAEKDCEVHSVHSGVTAYTILLYNCNIKGAFEMLM